MPAREESGRGYTLHRVRRHLYWARTQGVRRLVEEDELDPRRRAALAWSKWRWRRTGGVRPGEARAVFLLGAQRSGTNMMVRGLESAPQFEVRNENDRAAFRRFRLRDEAVGPIVAASRHRYVLFKPLCDSHRAVELLADPRLSRPPLAVWAYRDVDGRVRSAVAKFGDANRQALAAVADGAGADRWEAGGLDEERLELLRRLRPAELSAESAAALFWYLRNELYFRLGLDRRCDVALVGYGSFVADPAGAMTRLCRFLDLPFSPALVAHVDGRASVPRPALDLDPRVRELCGGLGERLAAAELAAGATRDQ